MLAQVLPDGLLCEIIVVDDGSDDDTALLLSTCNAPNVRILRLSRNQGRSAARNAGATHARGEFLAFVDCDCRPATTHFLASHLRMLRNNYIATCGPVAGDGHGFWSRYQSDASARRARQHAQGASFAGSTQNFAVRTEAFRQVGGFDTRYKEYGFEDRDLFVRLSKLGALGWCVDASVVHFDTLTLPGVLGKMHRAGGDSAELFARDHADAYEKLGYAALDTRLHAWLRPVALLLNPLLGIAPSVDRLLNHRQIPYVLVKPLVKLLVALAYMHGTSDRPRAQASGRK